MSGGLLQVPALLGQRLVSFSLTYLVCDGEANHGKPGVAFHHPLAGTASKLLGPGRKDLPSIPWLVRIPKDSLAYPQYPKPPLSATPFYR